MAAGTAAVLVAGNSPLPADTTTFLDGHSVAVTTSAGILGWIQVEPAPTVPLT